MPTRKKKPMTKSRSDAPADGHVEGDRAEGEHEQELEHAEHEVGEELAEHDLEPPDGRGEELLHRAALPLAGDGEGGEQHGADGEEVGGEPRHHEQRRAARPGCSASTPSPASGGARAARAGPASRRRLGAHEGVRLREHLVRDDRVGAVHEELHAASDVRRARTRSP